MLDFGRELCSDRPAATAREWLVTNGIGGYASGTISGIHTRRYHGLLMAALDPPLGRTLLVSHVDEEVQYGGRSYALATHRWHDGTVAPTGHRHLDRFHLEGTVPVWTYALGDALLEKRVWMVENENTTCVRYTLPRGSHALSLHARLFVNHRPAHTTTQAGDWTMARVPTIDGVRVDAYDGAVPIFLRSADAGIAPEHEWHYDFSLPIESERGLDACDDHLHAATARVTLAPGDAVTLVASTDPDAPLDGDAALARRQYRDDRVQSQTPLEPSPPAVSRLLYAADAFIVKRPTDAVPTGHSILAGYPWFGDWGRDTMIALPGLTLTTGRPAIAASILRTYAEYVDRGMIPNRFPERGAPPDYNTVDATLWYVEAIRAYVAHTDDTDLLRDLWPVLTSIVDWHVTGTRHRIHVDPADGLLYAGEPGVQLTWMDAKIDDWVVTPRTGKPVEVNALWYNALRSLAACARRLGEDDAPFDDRADRVDASFDRFWNEHSGHCLDVLDGPDAASGQLRPNQLFAVSLPHSPLSRERQRAVVDACADHLLTPHGLRSLSPDDPDYVGRYEGDREARDGAYHQGTVWGWLIGPFVKAHLRVYDDPDTARSFLLPLCRHLAGHGVGQLSEIFDGDAPFTPRGTPAQAWTVAQVLEAWAATEQ